MRISATIKSFSKGDRVTFKALGVTDKYVSPNIIDSLLKHSINQPLIYRHVHPSSPGEGQILGTIIGANKVDADGHQGIEIEAEMLQYTDYQRDAVDYVIKKQESDPIKISIGMQEFGEAGKEPIDARPFEYSLTDIPVCEECATFEVKLMEKDEATASELKIALDKAYEENKKLTAKLENIEKQTGAAQKTLEDSITAAVATVRNEYSGQITKLQTTVDALTSQLDKAKRQPIIDEIVKREKDPELVPFYEKQPIEWLQARLEKKRKDTPPTIVTQTLQESQMQATDVEMEQKLRETVKKRIMENPTLSKIIFGRGLDDSERIRG